MEAEKTGLGGEEELAGGLSPEEIEAEKAMELPDREALTVIDANFTVINPSFEAAPIEPPGADNMPLYHTQTSE